MLLCCGLLRARACHRIRTHHACMTAATCKFLNVNHFSPHKVAANRQRREATSEMARYGTEERQCRAPGWCARVHVGQIRRSKKIRRSYLLHAWLCGAVRALSAALLGPQDPRAWVWRSADMTRCWRQQRAEAGLRRGGVGGVGAPMGGGHRWERARIDRTHRRSCLESCNCPAQNLS